MITYVRDEIHDEQQLIRAFYDVAGDIVDRQIQWTPMQEGRFDVATRADKKTLTIKFSGFPENTTLTLRSANGTTVRLGLTAAGAAIAAMNWVLWRARDGGKSDLSRLAEEHFNSLLRHTHNGNAFTPEERLAIRRYID